MKKLSITILLLLGCFALSPALQAARDAGQPTFTQIDVPGSVFTVANGINAQADIVGAYVDSSGQTSRFSAKQRRVYYHRPAGSQSQLRLPYQPGRRDHRPISYQR